MAFTMSMSARRCPVGFGGMDHGLKIITARYCSHTTPALGSAYNDEEEEPPPAGIAAGNGMLVLTAHCEYPSIPNDAAHDGFAVMVQVKAPTLVGEGARRTTPLDLVAVLDVRESMAGPKLEEVKRAMEFVVDSLGPRDRLSVVAFSDDARRVVRLTRMSGDGKAAARRAVESLVAAGSSNIRAGLDEAAKVIEESRRDNDVAGVILLSDGYDNHSACRRSLDTNTTDYSDLVPPYLVRDGRLRCTPVHTFAFGSDHDEEALHSISAATGGTFSFVENHAAIQDALALCVGGLRSVTAQDVWIEVKCWDLDLSIAEVKSGCYKNDITRDEGASVSVGELYADEERRFLFLLDVPSIDDAKDLWTRLVEVRCEYLDMATGQAVSVEPADVYIEVRRPLDAAPVAPSMEVERERLRVEAAEDVALAHAAAERGAYAEAARILAARRESVSRSAASLAGDAKCKALAAELDELRLRAADEREYRRTGRACFLASMSAHALQRGSSVRLPRPLSAGLQHFGWAGSAMFATPAMRKMEKSWEMRRQRKSAPAPLPKGSKAAPPRSRLEAIVAAAAPRLSMLRRYLVPLIKP